MRIITDFNQKSDIDEPIAAALGYFDGLHLGHQAIINATNIEGYKRGVLTFKNQPASFISHSKKPYRLMSLDDKIEQLEAMGTDYLFLYEFTDQVKNMTKEMFIDICLKKWSIQCAVAGFNFHFGKNKEGDTDYLEAVCEENNIGIKVIPPVLYQGEVISSTLIKKKLYTGDVEDANCMLSRPFYIKGKVIGGKKLGRTIGVPTANIEVSPEILVPKWGVYHTITTVRGIQYLSVTNVGNNPTIQGDTLRVESHIIDFNEEIYGEEIKIEFIRHIREEKQFQDINMLKAQICSDIESVQKFCRTQK